MNSVTEIIFGFLYTGLALWTAYELLAFVYSLVQGIKSGEGGAGLFFGGGEEEKKDPTIEEIAPNDVKYTKNPLQFTIKGKNFTEGMSSIVLKDNEHGHAKIDPDGFKVVGKKKAVCVIHLGDTLEKGGTLAIYPVVNGAPDMSAGLSSGIVVRPSEAPSGDIRITGAVFLMSRRSEIQYQKGDLALRIEGENFKQGMKLIFYDRDRDSGVKVREVHVNSSTSATCVLELPEELNRQAVLGIVATYGGKLFSDGYLRDAIVIRPSQDQLSGSMRISGVVTSREEGLDQGYVHYSPIPFIVTIHGEGFKSGMSFKCLTIDRKDVGVQIGEVQVNPDGRTARAKILLSEFYKYGIEKLGVLILPVFKDTVYYEGNDRNGFYVIPTPPESMKVMRITGVMPNSVHYTKDSVVVTVSGENFKPDMTFYCYGDNSSDVGIKVQGVQVAHNGRSALCKMLLPEKYYRYGVGNRGVIMFAAHNGTGYFENNEGNAFVVIPEAQKSNEDVKIKGVKYDSVKAGKVKKDKKGKVTEVKPDRFVNLRLVGKNLDKLNDKCEIRFTNADGDEVSIGKSGDIFRLGRVVKSHKGKEREIVNVLGNKLAVTRGTKFQIEVFNEEGTEIYCDEFVVASKNPGDSGHSG